MAVELRRQSQMLPYQPVAVIVRMVKNTTGQRHRDRIGLALKKQVPLGIAVP